MLLAGLGLPLPGGAHPSLGGSLQHRVWLVLGPEYLDIEVELFFFSQASYEERRVMDQDRNGLIDATEIGAYLERVDEELRRGLALKVDGQAVKVFPLYTPEIDVMGSAAVGRRPHSLRLHYFTPTANWASRGVGILFEDRLWPHVAASFSYRVQGKDGVRVEVEMGATTGTGAAEAARDERLLRIRCIAFPAKTATAAADRFPE